ncbi:aldo/keto reductase [Romeria aff. gracilis LEGE 07310]|uniref:Aldo/keto reductase n=1 Tax=Vasconcelosia minhoensis LEGE 07310 TaxID=915328 RepID=A0A8J7AKG2_9CYAN|nr:aldo/keto reductase [Romeria gracilis]MBE9080459.1 aldo/keto reductase [Romeria aff. gracilis LEGE 07310]
MLYRRFGRTELQMPVLSCGGMRYQHSWKDVPQWMIPQKNQKNLAATIHRAIELGISHIETARGYGTSEIQLGRVLPQLPREQIIVQTKVSPKPQPKEFLKIFEQSLSNLKLDYVDLLGLHGVNTPAILQYCLDGCLEVAQQLKTQGKVRHIGFSTHAPTQVILDAIETDQFDYVNLHWYYIFQDNWLAIEAARRHDMGVFIISPSDKGGHLYNPSPKLVELCQPLSPMVFNDLFCLRLPQVHTLSLGAARPSDFDEHLQAVSLLERADELLPPILERLEAAAIAALGPDWYHTWQEGLPAPENTPGQLNIPITLWLGNLLDAYDMSEYAQARYNLLGSGGHWFPGQKADRLSDLDLSDCLSRSPHAAKIPARLANIHQRISGTPVKRLSQQ